MRRDEMTGLFVKRPIRSFGDVKVLVCSLHRGFDELLRADSEIYSRYYQKVDEERISSIAALIERLDQGYDVVHLFATGFGDGRIGETDGTSISGTELIDKCCERGVRLLWIANENAPECYIKGFRAAGKPLNLVMTLRRNGGRFLTFLEMLLSSVSAGKTLPVAWTTLVPQQDGAVQEGFPSCIFFAGKADAILQSNSAIYT